MAGRENVDIDGLMVFKGNLTERDQNGNIVPSVKTPDKYQYGSKEQANIARKTDNNYTTEEKEKLAGIEEGAEVNVQSDWNENNSSSDAYIKNKPTIGDGTLTIQKNGVDIDTFGANATSDKTINIIIPTTASDVSALPASTKYAASLALSINTTNYVMTAQLKDQDGNNIGNSASVDFPLESVVVNGEYDNDRKEIVLTLQNGNTVEIPVADLVAGLQPAINEENKLDYSLIDNAPENLSNFNNDTNFITSAALEDPTEVAAAALNELNRRINAVFERLEGGDYIEVQKLKVTREIELPEGTIPSEPVQSDWNENDSSKLSYIKNKPNIPSKTSDLQNDSGFITLNDVPEQVQADWDEQSQQSPSYIKNKPTIPDAPVQSDWEEEDQSALDYIKNKPTIPDAQIQSDWSQSDNTKKDFIKNKPSLAQVATSGSYNDLLNKPDIPDAQIQSDWEQDDNTKKDYIKNKPSLADVATSGDYDDLDNKPSIPSATSQITNDSGFITEAALADPSEVAAAALNDLHNRLLAIESRMQSIDYLQVDKLRVMREFYCPALAAVAWSGKYADLIGTPSLAAVATSGSYNDLTDKPSIPDEQIQSDWSQSDSTKKDFIKNKPNLAQVATSGSYDDLTNKPTIPDEQIQSDWNQSDNTKKDFIKNKPTIPVVNDGILTIKRNNTAIDTFSANASQNKDINIVVPTTASDVSALPDSTKYAANLSLSINSSTYVITAQLLDQNGDSLGNARTIDLPLESVVVNGSYDSTNKYIVLTLESGSVINIPVGDLVAGLQSEITSNNPLSCDLLADGTNNKVFTATMLTKLNSIESGAEVNVQSDWNESNQDSDAFIKNKPTIPTQTSQLTNNSGYITEESLEDPTEVAAEALVDHERRIEALEDKFDGDDGIKVKSMVVTRELKAENLSDVAYSGNYNDLSNKPSIPAAQVQSDWNQSDNTKVDFIKNKPSIPAAQIQSDYGQTNPDAIDFIKNKPNLAQVATSGNYNDLSNKPTIPDAQIQSDWNQTDNTKKDFIKNKPNIPTVPTNVSDFNNDAGYITINDVPTEVVYCYYTETDSTNHTGTVSITIEQINAAVSAGKAVVLTQGDQVYYLDIKGNSPAFCCLQGLNVHQISYYTSDSKWHKTTITASTAQILVCFLTYSNNEYTCNRTIQEILSAYQTGKVVICIYDAYEYYCQSCDSSNAVFVRASSVSASQSNVSGIGFSAIVYSSSAWHYYGNMNVQPLLIGSGTGQNIKTINNESVLGSGNIDTQEVFFCYWNGSTITGMTVSEIIAAREAGYCVVAEISESLILYLSSAVELDNTQYVMFTNIINMQSIYLVYNGTSWVYTEKNLQTALIGSGTGQNIKTVGGQSVLGSGDIPLTGNDVFWCELTLSGSTYSMDKTAQEIYEAVINDKKVAVCKFNTQILYCFFANQESNSYQIKFTQITNDDFVAFIWTNGSAWYYKSTSFQGKLVGSGTGQNIKTVGGQNLLGSGDIPLPTSRTINGEQLTDSSLGDINIHDGFYFPNAVQDYDGNWYGAVVIGDQVWLGENLRTTQDANGNAVEYYNDEQSPLSLRYRGLLYKKAAVMNGESASSSAPSGVQGISPDGWHIPSASEYQNLTNYLSKNKRHLSDKSNQYSNAKSVASTSGWTESNVDYSVGNEQDENNSAGFNAYPVNSYTGSSIIGYGSFTYFHVTNDDGTDPENYMPSYSLSFFGISFSVTRISNGLNWSISVRCVSDLTPLQFRDWYINQYGSLQHQVASAESGFQPTLVSGSNIKTINGESVLGTGNISLTPESETEDITKVTAAALANANYRIQQLEDRVQRLTEFIASKLGSQGHDFD